jgi:hypothetical protein
VGAEVKIIFSIIIIATLNQKDKTLEIIICCWPKLNTSNFKDTDTNVPSDLGYYFVIYFDKLYPP